MATLSTMNGSNRHDIPTEIFIPGKKVQEMGDERFNGVVDELQARTGLEYHAQYFLDGDAFRVFTDGTPYELAVEESESKKKIPRPMNCFILYRDSEYRVLKETHPELTVQRISQLVAKSWKAGGPELQEFWKEEARKVKELHELMYPDYQYSPRKPGEKKRRQRGSTITAPAEELDDVEENNTEEQVEEDFVDVDSGAQAAADFNNLINWDAGDN